jgi:hypothetical protein
MCKLSALLNKFSGGNMVTKKNGSSKSDRKSASHTVRPKRARTSFLVRHRISSDNHPFVGRIYDLSIVAYHFDTYEELAAHADCRYVFHINDSLSTLTQRVESLNVVGSLLWPVALPSDFKDFPVSRYEWLNLTADAFLMRYISVVDCALLLINEIYETGLEPRKCSIDALDKRGVSGKAIAILKAMQLDQGRLREERNSRFHHGKERSFSQDDVTFRFASLFEHRHGGVDGTDQFGRTINLERSLREGLVEMQSEFNRSTRRLVRLLNRLYDLLRFDFELRFKPRIRNSKHGLRAGGQPETDELSNGHRH